MIKVVIVDDELLAGVGIQSLIHMKEGIEVKGLFSGPEEAIPFLEKNSVDVVMTDIEMAEMNGLDFIRIIRERNLAKGVIILSCHDDFSYAQEAIQNGTDSYMLKHRISGKLLIDEIKKVYQKTSEKHQKETGEKRRSALLEKTFQDECYVLGIVKSYMADQNRETGIGGQEGEMFFCLLEGIISRYHMGTMFFPYGKVPFILFQMNRNVPKESRKELLSSNIQLLVEHICQLFTGKMLMGLSGEFVNLQEMNERYEEAVRALDMKFYHNENNIFFPRDGISEFQMTEFHQKSFLESEGLEIFRQELMHCLARASVCCVSPQELKGKLVQALSQLVFHVLDRQAFKEEFVKTVNPNVKILSIITDAGDVVELEAGLLQVMEEFREKCRVSLHQDEFTNVFAYIEEHLAEKITLVELADLCYMSVPSFTKKFKLRTGDTLVQYLNERRIERAKQLLKNKSYSLEKIAEETGFSNANYLIRVFKKTTGKTVSEYRS